MTKIYISPSSQQANIGVVSGYVEEVVCNRIADVTERVLKSAGQEVKRNNPSNGYAAHTDESNAWGADIHVPIHTNAAGATARGARVGCSTPTNPDKLGTKLAQSILNRLSPITPANDLLVQYTFDEVVRTIAVAAYIEISFHSNVEDANWILNNIELIGKTIALGILDYLGIAYVEPPPPTIDYKALYESALTKINELELQINTLIPEKDKLNEAIKILTDTVTAQNTEMVTVAQSVEFINAFSQKYSVSK
jgi:N-acetylmuramoyl-L-alanine amidase